MVFVRLINNSGCLTRIPRIILFNKLILNMKRLLGIFAVAACLIFVTSCKDDEKAVIGGEITSVAVSTFSMEDAGGAAWDFDILGSENPDLEVRFSRGAAVSNDYIGGGERHDDAESPGNYVFDEFPDAWNISELNDEYTIGLYDYDLVGPDEMTTFVFSPSDHTSGAPSSFELTNGVSTIRVNVSWILEE